VLNDYDYLILGGGLSGLHLALSLEKDPFFKEKNIAVIEASSKQTNDRTWCFWEKESGPYPHLVSHSWPEIIFKSPYYSDTIALAPYHYKKIEGAAFYAFAKAQLNCDHIQAKVEAITDHDTAVEVITDKGRYTAKKVFSSILDPKILTDQTQQQYLKQHFIGWFIKTDTPVFDPTQATFMDFSIPQKGNCRFMYVLPTSQTEALFEYTLFSKDLLEEADYETAIQAYLNDIGISQYHIVAKEKGNIPMTSYNFAQHNTKNIIHIGSAGGWTKASTGFTFTHTLKKTEALLDFLKQHDDLRRFRRKNRFWWYDLVFVDVLYRKNWLGARIFATLFQKNPIDRIFRFLNDESSFKEELAIMWSLPKTEFIRAAFHRIGALFR
jgi:lycopene beta-cyclase